MVWTGSLVLIGFYTTEAIKNVQRGVEYFIVAASAVFIIAIFFAGRGIMRKSAEQDPPASEMDDNLPEKG
jgi:Na+/H+ antiporter NhaC